jgi:sec-independent protein translocase protein TatB
MFDIGWADFLVLIVAGLFILGPERLPGAAAWLAKSIKSVRQFASGAQQQLKSELGPEFEELRKPLEDLRGLRNFDPKRAVTKQLWDMTGGYDPRDDLKIDFAALNGTHENKDNVPDGYQPNGFKQNGFPALTSPTAQEPLTPGEQPPFDPDAT